MPEVIANAGAVTIQGLSPSVALGGNVYLSLAALGAAPTGAGGDNHRQAWEKGNENFLRLRVAALQEAISGSAGFADVSGAVTLSLLAGRVFLIRATGNVTSLSFSDVPSSSERVPEILLAIRIDGVGGHTFAGLPAVTWLDGSTWSDLNLAANANNFVHLLYIDGTLYGSMLYTGELSGDPYKACFLANATIFVVTENEYIDIPNATKPQGDGAIAYQKNGATITLKTLFAQGDRLGIVCTGLTTTTAVRIPRVLV